MPTPGILQGGAFFAALRRDVTRGRRSGRKYESLATLERFGKNDGARGRRARSSGAQEFCVLRHRQQHELKRLVVSSRFGALFGAFILRLESVVFRGVSETGDRAGWLRGRLDERWDGHGHSHVIPVP